jgi:peptidoglycan-N-acetylglucosamine deacetylase
VVLVGLAVSRADAGGREPGNAPAPAATAAPAAPPVTAAPPERPRPPVVVAVDTTERVVALTFDDGPDPRWTPPVLDALGAVGARATFFVTGEHVRAHPELLRAVAAAGHEIANHTDTHPHMDGLPAAAVVAEVQQAAAAIEATGLTPAPLFRPPRGRYGEEALAAVSGLGVRTVGWTVCFERWLRVGPALGIEEALARIRPGGIVLAHDGGIPDRAATVAALPVLLDRVVRDGYRVVPVGELLALGSPRLGLPGAWTPPVLQARSDP